MEVKDLCINALMAILLLYIAKNNKAPVLKQIRLSVFHSIIQYQNSDKLSVSLII